MASRHLKTPDDARKMYQDMGPLHVDEIDMLDAIGGKYWRTHVKRYLVNIYGSGTLDYAFKQYLSRSRKGDRRADSVPVSGGVSS